MAVRLEALLLAVSEVGIVTTQAFRHLATDTSSSVAAAAAGGPHHQAVPLAAAVDGGVAVVVEGSGGLNLAS